MPKNIIICCDGTGNQLKETYSNVVKLYTIIEKSNAQQQIAYYDPGVGTIGDDRLLTPWSQYLSKMWSLATGSGLRKNVSEAYAYLMEYYEEGDRIFLFGFSRGAYTVRVLAALIYQTGLLTKGCHNLIPYAYEAYKVSFTRSGQEIAARFKSTYSRDVKIHFMGVWDTVTSIGLFNTKKLPFTTNNPYILNIRHAVAIDEKRTYYRQNLFGNDSGTESKKEVWFAGVHSDVGGSYALHQSGLSQLALEWMVFEALAEPLGLLVNEEKLDEVLYDSKGQRFSVPDVKETVHRSLAGFWWLLEFVPRRKRYGFPIFLPRGKSRTMVTTPTIHASVEQKLKNDPAYRPDNIHPHFQVEPYNCPRVLRDTAEAAVNGH